jgi:hypothetical protein
MLVSGEDDLSAAREGVELSDRDGFLDLGDEVLAAEPEQVDGCLAAAVARPYLENPPAQTRERLRALPVRSGRSRPAASAERRR